MQEAHGNTQEAKSKAPAREALESDISFTNCATSSRL